jgi:hypothetical protein
MSIKRHACSAMLLALLLVPVARAHATPPAASSARDQQQKLNRLVIADYMMWYQVSTFDGKQSFDVPNAGGYNSDDIGTIQMHLGMAGRACLDGFAAHWYGAKEPRTTANFEKLLAASAGTNMRHAVLILENILPGAKEQDLSASVSYVLSRWGGHPNYLRLDGKPVIFFEGMTRPWRTPPAALQGWARVRAASDPNRSSIWFAEGLNTYYNPLFDGLYVYRVDHRTAPGAWRKQPNYANALRKAEAASGQKLYFADSIAPGFDDTRSFRQGKFDLRTPSPAFARDRRGGQYYRDTFAPTLQTNGDMLLVKSFNEWIEGTAIEPGRTYGDLYLNLTCELANAYRNPPPPPPTPTAVVPPTVEAP